MYGITLAQKLNNYKKNLFQRVRHQLVIVNLNLTANAKKNSSGKNVFKIKLKKIDLEIDWLLFIDQQQDHTKSAESYVIISLAHPTEKVIPNDL